MSFIRNMKIRAKFTIIFILSVISIGIVGIAGITSVNSSLGFLSEEFSDVSLCVRYIKDLDFNFSRAEIYLRNYVLTTDEDVKAYHLETVEYFAEGYNGTLKDYMGQLEAWEWEWSDEYKTLVSIRDTLEAYEKLRDEIISLSGSGSYQEAVDLLNNEAEPIGINIDELNMMLYSFNENDTAGMINSSQDKAASAATFIILFAVIMIIVLVVLMIIIASLITRPVIAMSSAAQKMAKGDLNVELGSNAHDEVGVLSNNLLSVRDIISKIVDDITVMTKNQRAGDIEHVIDEDAYEGYFKTVTAGVNEMSADFVADIKRAMNSVEEIGNGNFNFEVPKFPGKKEFISSNIMQIKSNLGNVNTEINRLVQSAVVGNLSQRSDSSRFNGDWFKIIDGINNLLDSITKPLGEASSVLKEMSMGNFSELVVGDYKGDFRELKESINTTARSMINNVSEIIDIFETLSNKNSNLNITISRDYSEAFVSIKGGIDSLISVFTSVLLDIASASEQVESGSRQVSALSSELSTNSATQASSVVELTDLINEITEGITNNHSDSKKASSISVKTTKSVSDGNKEMHNLLEAMDNIQTASNKIIQVIKVIDDIAFQTNLLALNAAVEAARAGEHGKGFAIVAEEVRNLANRSKQAAGETATLIQDSISKVDDGSRIVKSTAGILNVISDDTAVMNDIIEHISSESKKQAGIITRINEDINSISDSTNENTESSRETAEISEELMLQSGMLNDLVSKYSL